MSPRSEFGYIFQRKGRPGWYGRYTHRGVEVWIGSYTSRKHVRIALSRVQGAISLAEASGMRPVGRKTVKQFEPDLIAYLKRVHKPSTFKHDLVIWRGVILPAWGDAVLCDVTRQDVQTWLTARSAGGAGGATLNRNLSFLSVLFELAKESKLTLENPCAGIQRAKEEQKEHHYVSPEDLARVLQHSGADAPLFEFLAGTGLRLGEAEALLWSDVYLRPAAGCQGELVVRKSKSARSRRIALQERVYAVLETLNLARPANAQTTDPVFPSKPSTHRSALRRRLHRALKAAGLPLMPPHDLRHYFGSDLTQGGVPITVVSGLMGHSTIGVTMRYAKHAPSDAGSQAIHSMDEQKKKRTGARSGAGQNQHTKETK